MPQIDGKPRASKGWLRSLSVLKETAAEASKLQGILGRKPELMRLWFTRSIRAHVVLAVWIGGTALFTGSVLRELPIWLEGSVVPSVDRLLVGGLWMVDSLLVMDGRLVDGWTVDGSLLSGMAAGLFDALELPPAEVVIGASWLLGLGGWAINLWLRLPRAASLAALGARGREIRATRLMLKEPERSLALFRSAVRLTPDPVLEDRVATKIREVQRQIRSQSEAAEWSRAPTGKVVPIQRAAEVGGALRDPSTVATGTVATGTLVKSVPSQDQNIAEIDGAFSEPSMAPSGDALPAVSAEPTSDAPAVQGAELPGEKTVVSRVVAPVMHEEEGEGVGPAGRYTLHRELGRGGMAVVFHATDEVLGREVALKQMHLGGASDKSLEERFRLEARALASLTHPNIVQIYDLFEHDGELWIAMELVKGGDLADALDERGIYTAVEAFEVLVPIARGLAAAHARGIVHRDVKPMNILIARDGTPKLTDFGIAKLTETSVHTVAGSVMGSPHYMSPEQASGESADTPTDMYSLGTTLYLLVTGRTPFDGAVSQIMAKQITQAPPTPVEFNDLLDRGTEQLILEMLEKKPADRLDGMLQFAARAEELMIELRALER